MSASENTARSYLTGRLQALTGEAIPPGDDPGRLARALAAWDIQCHRALARDPHRPTSSSSPALKGSSPAPAWCSSTRPRPQASSIRRTDWSPDSRSRPRMERAWCHPLGRPGTAGTRLEESLVRATAEVRAAYRQITHDTTTLATTEVIAARLGLPQATGATLRAIEAGPELAHVVAEKADTPDLMGPAQVLSRRAHNVVEAGLAAPPAESDVVWVSPADILAGAPSRCRSPYATRCVRQVPQPRPRHPPRQPPPGSLTPIAGTFARCVPRPRTGRA